MLIRKDETVCFDIKGFVGLFKMQGLLKIYSFLIDDSSEHKKAKGMNKNVIAKTSHHKYKDALLNKKCLRHSMNRIQRQDHRIRT